MNEKVYELLALVQQTAETAAVTAADAAYGVGLRTARAVECAKARMRLASLEKQAEELLTEVGEMMYDTHTGHPTDSDALLEKLREIDGVKAEIKAAQDSLGIQDAAGICPTCGAERREGDLFCRECGGKL